MVETFHAAIADAFGAAETTVEDAFADRGARVAEYLLRPDLRDERIWRSAFAAAEAGGVGLTPDDWSDSFAELLEVPPRVRTLGWQAIVNAFISAATAQYDAENVLAALWADLEAGNLAVMQAAARLARPLAAEAKKGPSKATMAAAKKKILEARHAGGENG